MTNRNAALLVLLLGASACSSSDDAQPGTGLYALHKRVADDAPLPVPPDTIIATDNTNHVAVGSLPGTSDVTVDGQAHYRIPIWVSPGRAGVQPELALEYLSRAPNGLVGVGWMLTGFSQITRCQRTFALDNRAAPLKFDGSDAFCLDGERLIQNVSYPANPSYALEHDSFIRVTVTGVDANNNPTGFTAYEKNGRIRHYAFIGPMGGSLPSYPSYQLTQIEDRYGNAINFKYDVQLTAIPYSPVTAYYAYPSSIEYTASTTNPALVANRSVKFTYETRPDVEMWFNDGAVRLAKRLSTIEIWGPDPTTTSKTALLQKYALTYALPTSTGISVTGRSLLTSVTLSDVSGNRLGTTNFDWEKGAVGYTPVQTSATADVNDEKGFRVVDLNNDGFADLLYVVKDGSGNLVWATRLWSPGIGDFGSVNTLNLPRTKDQFGNYTFPTPALTDVKTSAGLLLWGAPPGTPPNTTVPMMQELMTLPTGTVALSTLNTFSNTADTVFPADFDGDGLADVVVGWTLNGGQSTFQYFRNTATHPATFASPLTLDVPAAAGKTKIPGSFAAFRGTDLDGDGRQEVVFCFPEDGSDAEPNSAVYVATPEKTFGYLGQQYAIEHRDPIIACGMPRFFPHTQQIFADFNGDGLDDSFQKSQHLNDPAGDVTYQELILNYDPRVISNNWSGLTGYRGRVPLTKASLLAADDVVITPIDYNLDDRPDLFITRPGQPIVMRRYALSDYLVNDVSPFDTDLFMNDIVSDKDNAAIQVADVNGDGLSDFVMVQSGRYYVYLHKGNKPDMMTSVVDGVGAKTSFIYQPISNPAVYSPRLRPEDYTYPLRSVSTGVWVVHEHDITVGSGGTQQKYFHTYQGASEDVQGRGFLGFDVHEIDLLRDDGSSVDETQEYDNGRHNGVEPYIGEPTRVTTTVRAAHGAIVHQAVRQQSLAVHMDDFRAYWTYPTTITLTDYDADAAGALQPTFTSTYTVSSTDGVGHILSASVSDGGGTQTTYDWTYKYDSTHWLIDMPAQLVTSSTGPRPCPTCRAVRQVRTTAWKYDDKGGIEWEIVEPNIDASGQISALPQPQSDGVQTLFTHYVRNADGQVDQITRDLDFVATPKQRTATFYRDDADRAFVTRVVNKLGHMIHIATQPGYGVVAARQDENGNYSRWQYDRFARLKRGEPATGEATSLTYAPYQATGADPKKPSLELHIKGDGGAEYVTQYDLVEQPLHHMSYDRNDGLGVVVDSTYDASNHLLTRTRPRFESAVGSVADRYTYDAADRFVRADYADGRARQQAFVAYPDGLHVEQWDADPREETAIHSTSTFDLSARVATRIQHARAKDNRPARDLVVTYSYGAYGLLTGTTSLGGPRVSVGYNRLGRPSAILDPSFGSHYYAYDAFGEVTTETLASELRQRTYDDLGRVQTLQTRDGTTKWIWDGPNALGELAEIDTPSGAKTTYAYDWADRTFDQTLTVGGSSYDITTQLDALGRIALLQYPPIGGNRFAVRYAYGTRGALQTIARDSVTTPFYTRLETDAAGKPTNASGLFPQFSLGNGVTVRYGENPTRNGLLANIVSTKSATTLQSLTYDFDVKGHVKLRRDEKRGLSETFDYDELDRLEHWIAKWGTSGQSTVRYDYDDFGNLTGRTHEVGAGSNATYGYTGERNGGPYAVTTVNGQALSYDDDGNQSAAPGRTASFAAFGLPLSIAEGPTSAQFRYDGGNERVEKTLMTNGAADDTVVVGRIFRKHAAGANVDYAATVMGPQGPLAYVTFDAAGATTSTSYVLQDHLGSADTIVDDNGVFVETRKFDPFGNQFDPANPLGPAPTFVSAVPYGFTGHEHDRELGLINMRGRIFDPTIGRFVSPDSIGGSLTSPLGLNLYAYAANDPATLIDPSGFGEHDPSGDGDGEQPPIGVGFPWPSGGGNSGNGIHYASPAPAQTGTQYKQYNAVDTATQRAAAKTLVRMTWENITKRYGEGKIVLTGCHGSTPPEGMSCSYGFYARDERAIYDVYERNDADKEGSNESINWLGRIIRWISPNFVRMNPKTKDAVANTVNAATLVGGIGISAVRAMQRAALEVAKDGEQLFYRLGKSWESPTRLANKAAESEAATIGPLEIKGAHGVSVSLTMPKAGQEFVTATRAEIEKEFELIYSPTKGDELHHTLILPKPVTKEIADVFNRLFGRMR